MNNPEDVQWFRVSAINDKPRVNRPEQDRLICNILPPVAHPGHVRELARRLMNLVEHLECILWTLAGDMIDNLRQVHFSRQRQLIGLHRLFRGRDLAAPVLTASFVCSLALIAAKTASPSFVWP